MAKNYTPVSYNTHNPDTMHLVHESVHKYSDTTPVEKGRVWPFNWHCLACPPW